jgi:hypothetical protein
VTYTVVPSPASDAHDRQAAGDVSLRLSCCADRNLLLDKTPDDPGEFNYNSAIAGSSNEQLLLNIVRLRYSETPVFLKVSSVINQYKRSAGISASAGYRTSVTGGDSVSGSGEVAWADSPTITYAPLSGKEFATNLLTPVPAWLCSSSSRPAGRPSTSFASPSSRSTDSRTRSLARSGAGRRIPGSASFSSCGVGSGRTGQWA